MASLALLVLTKNEATNIGDCLDSAKGVDEIIVIDDYSDDNTVAIAREHGAKVVFRKLDDFASQLNFALTQTKAEWVFYLDADERFSPNLLAEIKKHISEYPQCVGSVFRKNFAFGKRHCFGVLKPDRVVRLFPKNAVTWKGLVHSYADYQLVRRDLGFITHLTYRSWEHYYNKFNHYTTLWARDAHFKNIKFSYLSMINHSIWALIKMFIINLGILGGPICWSLCFFHASYTMTKYLKLKEISSNKS